MYSVGPPPMRNLAGTTVQLSAWSSRTSILSATWPGRIFPAARAGLLATVYRSDFLIDASHAHGQYATTPGNAALATAVVVVGPGEPEPDAGPVVAAAADEADAAVPSSTYADVGGFLRYVLVL